MLSNIRYSFGFEDTDFSHIFTIDDADAAKFVGLKKLISIYMLLQISKLLLHSSFYLWAGIVSIDSTP